MSSTSSNGSRRLARAEKNEEAFKQHNERRARLKEAGGCPPDEPVPFRASATIPLVPARLSCRSLTTSAPSNRRINFVVVPGHGGPSVERVVEELRRPGGLQARPQATLTAESRGGFTQTLVGLAAVWSRPRRSVTTRALGTPTRPPRAPAARWHPARDGSSGGRRLCGKRLRPPDSSAGDQWPAQLVAPAAAAYTRHKHAFIKAVGASLAKRRRARRSIDVRSHQRERFVELRVFWARVRVSNFLDRAARGRARAGSGRLSWRLLASSLRPPSAR